MQSLAWKAALPAGQLSQLEARGPKLGSRFRRDRAAVNCRSEAQDQQSEDSEPVAVDRRAILAGALALSAAMAAPSAKADYASVNLILSWLSTLNVGSMQKP